MELFSNTLGLPISWPLQTHAVATYGWITLGNTNLEFWASLNNEDLPGADVLPLFHGLALEPDDLAGSLEILNQRGISCKIPKPYITRTSVGRDVINFTNSVVLDVSSSMICIFFCEWGTEGTIFPWKEKITTTERKQKQQRQLLECAGGKLGITGLVEVEMLTTRLEEATERWLAITGQTQLPISLSSGVRLTLVAGDENRITSIVIGVRSFPVACQILSEEGLLGEFRDGEASLSRAVCSGLHFRFRQA